MLLRCFGFSQDPFGATPDPGCLYLSRTHREALASLKYGFYSNRGFTALIAQPGMGKTTLLNCLLNDIRGATRVVFLFNLDSLCDPKDLLGFILRDLGVTPGHSNAEMHAQLNEAIAVEARAGRILTIVVDEAQNLSDEVLEKLRMLTNFETTTGKLIQVVLAGQPQLSDKLMQPSLIQLRQRISIFCRLEPLTAEETLAYIDHHLKVAGYRGDPLFSSDALKLIESAGGGIPRVINNLCFSALSLCRALRKKQVDIAVAAEAIADRQLVGKAEVIISSSVMTAGEPPEICRMPMPRRSGRRIAIATGLLLVCALGALGISEMRSRRIDVGEMFSFLPHFVFRSQLQPVAAASNKADVANDERKMQLLEVATEPDQRIQGVDGLFQEQLSPKKGDGGHIGGWPKALAIGANGDKAPMIAPVKSTQPQTLLSTTKLATTEQAASESRVLSEMMNDQLTAPRRIPRNLETVAMLEAPSPGWGEVNLTGQDDLDMIGRVFRGEPGPVVMPDVTPKVVAIPSAVAAGLIVKKTAPMYPRDAKEARISGQVLLEATISATGSIESLHVLKGPDTLRQAAIDAVSKWRFKPYMLNDKPTAAEFMVGVSFTLADDGVFYR